MRSSKFLGALVVTAALGASACDKSEQTPTDGPGIGFAGAGGPDTCGIGKGSTPLPSGAVAFDRSGGPVSPQFNQPAVRADNAPPPISGGTLLTSADAKTLIAADSDRDAIYLIDIATSALVRRIELSASDEPGRVVQDKSGTVHVALRGGRGIVSFGLGADSPVRRSEVCDLPRGLAYDGAADRLYVACSEGVLAQLDPTTGTVTKKTNLGRDLRDVIVRGNQLFVTRFRTAELLQVDVTGGTVMASHRPLSTSQSETVFVPEEVTQVSGVCSGGGSAETRTNEFTSGVAWRTVDVAGQGLAMLHQRGGESEVLVSPGGYGGGAVQCAPGIVHGAISFGDDASLSVEIMQPGLYVDMAVDPTGSILALANPGGWDTPMALSLMRMPTPGESTVIGGTASCTTLMASTQLEGQPVAVTFVSEWLLAVQQREPAAISFYDVRTQAVRNTVRLNQPSRNDTGHTLFHLVTAAGLACASCHAEAGDDGRVWTFHGIGARRTQNLRGGILGSEPFHWNGDMKDFSMLVDEVFVGRMTAPEPTFEQADALAHWIDRQPLLHATASDTAAVARGQTLFESKELGCNTCHSGARLSNNESADVGTGAMLQVPSLRAISFRAPFMHDGCAKTLTDRFAACGGGDKHGHTSQLQAPQIQDLVAYLESL